MRIQELLIILAILLLVFGAKRLPSLAKSLGKSTREFKTGLSEFNFEKNNYPIIYFICFMFIC